MGLGKRVRKFLLNTGGRRMPMDVPPLRVPAQTLEDDFQGVLVAACLAFVGGIATVVVIVVSLAVGAIGTTWLNFFANCILGMVFSLPFAVIYFWMFRKSTSELQRIRVGLLAERLVGQQLERLRYDGYAVFHDMGFTEPKKFNVDHVIIGPAGIFVIESKGRSKPAKGKCEIEFETGKRDKFTQDDLDQASANANTIRKHLIKLLGKGANPVCTFDAQRPMPITPLLVYPGWYILGKGPIGESRVFVANDKSMLNFIRKSPQKLEKDEYIKLGELLGEDLREQHKHLLDY